jgi:hypothetical protein
MILHVETASPSFLFLKRQRILLENKKISQEIMNLSQVHTFLFLRNTAFLTMPLGVLIVLNQGSLNNTIFVQGLALLASILR